MNEFEKACNEVEKDRDYSLEQENAISFLKDSDIATVTFTQGRYITKIKKLSEKYPEDVQIVARTKGSITAYIPVSYIKINNSSREISEEERILLSERAKNNFHTVKVIDETE